MYCPKMPKHIFIEIFAIILLCALLKILKDDIALGFVFLVLNTIYLLIIYYKIGYSTDKYIKDNFSDVYEQVIQSLPPLMKFFRGARPDFVASRLVFGGINTSGLEYVKRDMKLYCAFELIAVICNFIVLTLMTW